MDIYQYESAPIAGKGMRTNIDAGVLAISQGLLQDFQPLCGIERFCDTPLGARL
jgi:hypothetical protein